MCHYMSHVHIVHMGGGAHTLYSSLEIRGFHIAVRGGIPIHDQPVIPCNLTHPPFRGHQGQRQDLGPSRTKTRHDGLVSQRRGLPPDPIAAANRQNFGALE